MSEDISIYAGIEITPIPGSRSASQTIDGKITFTASYQMLCNKEYSPSYVSSHQPFNVGDIVDNWPVTSVSIKETDEPTRWIIDLTYGHIDMDQDVNPLNRPWEYSIRYENHQVPVEKDIKNKPIVNTAQEVFQELVMVDQARPVLTAKRNFLDFPWGICNKYSNTLNRDTFFGAAPETLKIDRINPTNQKTYIDGLELKYFELVVEMAYNPETWKRKILNIGYNELIDGEKKRILDDQGIEVQIPVLLDKEGRKLEQDAPEHYVEFDLYRKTPYVPLFNM